MDDPLGVGRGQPVARLEQPEGAAEGEVAVLGHLEEVSVVAARVGPPVLVVLSGRRRRCAGPALLIGGDARGTEVVPQRIDKAQRRGAVPGDVAVVEDVRVGRRSAVVVRAAVKERLGGLRGEVARLRGPVVELLDLKVAVAGAGRQHDVAEGLVNHAIVIDDREDALVVADDQPRQAGRRVDLGDHPMDVGAADVERNPGHAQAVIREGCGVDQIQGRVGLEGRRRIADQVDELVGREGSIGDVRLAFQAGQPGRVVLLQGPRRVVGIVGIGDERCVDPDQTRGIADTQGLFRAAKVGDVGVRRIDRQADVVRAVGDGGGAGHVVGAVSGISCVGTA